MIITNIYREDKKVNYIEITLNHNTVFELELCEDSASLIYDFTEYNNNNKLRQHINTLQPEIEELLKQGNVLMSFTGIIQLMKLVNALEQRVYLY